MIYEFIRFNKEDTNVLHLESLNNVIMIDNTLIFAFEQNTNIQLHAVNLEIENKFVTINIYRNINSNNHSFLKSPFKIRVPLDEISNTKNFIKFFYTLLYKNKVESSAKRSILNNVLMKYMKYLQLPLKHTIDLDDYDLALHPNSDKWYLYSKDNPNGFPLEIKNRETSDILLDKDLAKYTNYDCIYELSDTNLNPNEIFVLEEKDNSNKEQSGFITQLYNTSNGIKLLYAQPNTHIFSNNLVFHSYYDKEVSKRVFSCNTICTKKFNDKLYLCINDTFTTYTDAIPLAYDVLYKKYILGKEEDSKLNASLLLTIYNANKTNKSLEDIFNLKQLIVNDLLKDNVICYIKDKEYLNDMVVYVFINNKEAMSMTINDKETLYHFLLNYLEVSKLKA